MRPALLAAVLTAAAALAAPAFALKGAAFYIFLLAILVWNEVVALRLKRCNSIPR